MSEPDFGAMEPEIIQMPALSVETDMGVEHVPLWLVCTPHTNMTATDWGIMLKEERYEEALELLSDYIEGSTRHTYYPELHLDAWLGRLTMPGYLDCTDWMLYESKNEAMTDLIETYALEEEE